MQYWETSQPLEIRIEIGMWIRIKLFLHTIGHIKMQKKRTKCWKSSDRIISSWKQRKQMRVGISRSFSCSICSSKGDIELIHVCTEFGYKEFNILLPMPTEIDPLLTQFFFCKPWVGVRIEHGTWTVLMKLKFAITKEKAAMGKGNEAFVKLFSLCDCSIRSMRERKAHFTISLSLHFPYTIAKQ